MEDENRGCFLTQGLYFIDWRRVSRGMKPQHAHFKHAYMKPGVPGEPREPRELSLANRFHKMRSLPFSPLPSRPVPSPSEPKTSPPVPLSPVAHSCSVYCSYVTATDGAGSPMEKCMRLAAENARSFVCTFSLQLTFMSATFPLLSFIPSLHSEDPV